MSRSVTLSENNQYRIGSGLLLLCSTSFIVWQMGVLYFSGTTMSLFGRTPIPITSADIMPVIVAGYIVSIALICLFPRRTVLMERIALLLALAASILMLLPLEPTMLTVLFCTAAFCCVFSIGTIMSVAAQHFTVETTWRDGIISMVVGGLLIAIMQSDAVKLSFTAFAVLSVLLIAAETVFFFLIPSEIKVSYVSRDKPRKMPKILFIGIWLISGFATLLVCFASSFAESVRGGVSAIYLSGAAMAAALFFLKRKLNAGAVRIFGGLFALSVFGFVLAFLSLYIAELRLLACMLLGFVVTLANLWIFFAACSFQVYPTRFVGAIGACMGLLLAAFHSGLQDALRGNIPLLYGIYAALSVALLLVYFFMEPYFMRMWSKYESCDFHTRFCASSSQDDDSPPWIIGDDSLREPAPIPPKRMLSRCESNGHKYEEQSSKASVKPPETPELEAETASKAPHPFDILSEQERILANLILDGYTETACAAAMNITLNTQKGYRKNLYRKLDIHSKRELFELARSRSDEE